MRKKVLEDLQRKINKLSWKIEHIEDAFRNGLQKCELCGAIIIEPRQIKLTDYGWVRHQDSFILEYCCKNKLKVKRVITICQKCYNLESYQLEKLIQCKFGKVKK